MRNELVTFQRDTPAVLVPDGTPATISAGMQGRVTQALGTSFTVVTNYGQMFRVESRHADAIGKDPDDFGVEIATDGTLEDQIWSTLSTCYDPEIPVNIVDLGLVYSCEIEPVASDPELHHVDIKMTLTAPGCGMGDVIKNEVEEKVRMLPRVDSVMVDLVFEPQWDRSMMSDEARLKTGLM
jgi:probable FeS assembly SUF system protein SufT